MRSVPQFIASPEDILSILEKNWASSGCDINKLALFKDQLHKAMVQSSRRGQKYHATIWAILLEDNTDFRMPELRTVSFHLSQKIVDLLPLNSKLFTNHLQTKTALSEILANDLYLLIAPTAFEYSNQSGSKRSSSIGDFFSVFPVLTRRVTHILSCLLEFFLEIFDNFENDREKLELTFHEPFRFISRIQLLPSDPHNGQKKSALLEFSNSSKLVYKPRSLAGETHLEEVINALNKAGLNFPSVTMFDQQTHGWMEWVTTPKNTPDSIEIAKQVGTLIALASTIALVDLHSENVLLSESGLIVIDAETVSLLSPDMRQQKPFLKPPNILELGILPHAIGHNRNDWWDTTLCGLTPGRQTVPAKIDYIESDNVLNPTVIYHQLANETLCISSIISKLDIRTLINSIVHGFQQAHSILSRLDPVVPSDTSRTHFRYIHRPTSAYLRTLFRMTDPACSLSVSTLIEEIMPYTEELQDQIATHSNPTTAPIVAEEIAALIYGDVPRLTSKHLDSAFPTTVTKPVWALPSNKLSTQLIEMSLRLRFLELQENSAKSPTSTSDMVLRNLNIASIANWIYHNLAIAKNENGKPCFLGITPHPQSKIPQITKIGTSLYDGVAGLLLIMGIASVLDEREEYRIFTQELLDVLKYAFENIERNPNKQVHTLANGPLGTLYAVSFLYKLSKSRNISSEYWANQIEFFSSFFEKDVSSLPFDSADVLTGLSGWLLTLDAIPFECNQKFKNLKISLTKRILELQEETGAWASLEKPGLCGFSHGAAGIRYALGRMVVSDIGSEHAINKAMISAFEFEQRSFVPQISNWQDYRFDETDPRAFSSFSAWCHGAAGIALAEAGLARIGLAFFRERIEPIVSTKSLVSERSSLCCGSAAYLESIRLLRESHLLPNDSKIFSPEPKFHQQEHDTPSALFRADYGTGFIKDMIEKIPYSPSILLLE